MTQKIIFASTVEKNIALSVILISGCKIMVSVRTVTNTKERYRTMSDEELLELAMLRASGHYLTEYLPEDFNNMSREELGAYCKDNASYIVEDLNGATILHEIETMAETMVKFAEEVN